MKMKYPQTIEKSCFESIVELLKEDKIKEALDFLSSKIQANEDLSNESKTIIIKYASHSRLKKKYQSALITDTEYDVGLNKLIAHLLDLASAVCTHFELAKHNISFPVKRSSQTGKGTMVEPIVIYGKNNMKKFSSALDDLTDLSIITKGMLKGKTKFQKSDVHNIKNLNKFITSLE